MKYYRFENRSISVRTDETGFTSYPDVFLTEFNVLKETPKGVWLDHYGLKRFVLHGARKKFAHPTIQLAKESFIARKNKQIKILTKQMDTAKLALVQVEGVAAMAEAAQ